MLRFGLSLFVCLALTASGPLGAPLAEAQPRASAAQGADEAKRHFEQGVALHRDRNLTAALAEFQAAYDGWSAAGQPLNALVALYNAGAVERDLQRYTDALATLKKFVTGSELLPKLKRTQAAEIKRMRADAQTLIAEMTALLAPVSLQVEPAQATVLLDGRTVTLVPGRPVDVAAGTHQLEVSAEGFTPQRRELTVVAGRPQEVKITLQAIVHTGTVTVTVAQPLTRLWIDGKEVGAPPVTVELPAGGHRLEAEAPGYLRHQSEVALAAGQRREIRFSLETPPPALVATPPVYKRWWFWGAIGAVAAGSVATALLVKPGTVPATRGSLDPGEILITK